MEDENGVPARQLSDNELERPDIHAPACLASS